MVIRIRRFISYFQILCKNIRSVRKRLSDWGYSLSNPTEFYLDAFRFYHFFLPRPLKRHKRYFNRNARGFGEKAFHTMWYLLYNRYKFKSFLEIGVYRGQTISLISLMSKLDRSEVRISGISPFDNSADEVSRYIEIDYLKDVLCNFDYFKLTHPILTKAYSTDDLARDLISSAVWDCIYIDGSHDYNIAKKDWLLCSANLKVGGLIVMDDSALYTQYKAPFFAFKGHPGPSKVANEIAENQDFHEILSVGHNRVFQKIR